MGDDDSMISYFLGCPFEISGDMLRQNRRVMRPCFRYLAVSVQQRLAIISTSSFDVFAST